MRKLILGLASAAATSLIISAGAQASCRTVSCLNREVSKLNKVVTADTKLLAAYARCLQELPMTSYGDLTGHTFGYVYNQGSGQPSYSTSALDLTNPGTTVSFWAMYDACNHKKSPARDVRTARDAPAGSPFGPIAPEAPLTSFFPAAKSG